MPPDFYDIKLLFISACPVCAVPAAAGAGRPIGLQPDTCFGRMAEKRGLDPIRFDATGLYHTDAAETAEDRSPDGSSSCGWPGRLPSSCVVPDTKQGEVRASSAPEEGALPALRAGGPVRHGYRRGAVPALHSPAARADAVNDLVTDFYANSTASAVRGRRACYLRILGLWGVQPHPIEPQKVLFLGAGLKRGGYRSAGSVLSQYRVDGTRAGCTLDQRTVQAFTDATRSCKRGVGPPRRALALGLPRFATLPADPEPWTPAGPLCPRNVLMISAWWLLRELEVASVRACHAQVIQGEPLVATLLLATSKSDPEARGVARAHPCICQGGRPRADCPVHALWDHLITLQRRFPGRFRGGVPEASLPLFPTSAGRAISKVAFTAVVLEGACRTDQPQANADGSLRLSGHSLRATGAQHLAKLGMDLLSIQLLGRWGSTALFGYIRDAATGVDAARARALPLGTSTRDLTTAATEAALPAPSADDFKERVAEWFHEWFATASQPRSSLAAEVAELLEQQAASTATATSSSSSSSSTSGGQSPRLAAEAVEPAIAEDPPDDPEPDQDQALSPSVLSAPVFEWVGNSKHKRNHFVVLAFRPV